MLRISFDFFLVGTMYSMRILHHWHRFSPRKTAKKSQERNLILFRARNGDKTTGQAIPKNVSTMCRIHLANEGFHAKG